MRYKLKNIDSNLLDDLRGLFNFLKINSSENILPQDKFIKDYLDLSFSAEDYSLIKKYTSNNCLPKDFKTYSDFYIQDFKDVLKEALDSVGINALKNLLNFFNRELLYFEYEEDIEDFERIKSSIEIALNNIDKLDRTLKLEDLFSLDDLECIEDANSQYNLLGEIRHISFSCNFVDKNYEKIKDDRDIFYYIANELFDVIPEYHMYIYINKSTNSDFVYKVDLFVLESKDMHILEYTPSFYFDDIDGIHFCLRLLSNYTI